jgi:hypothetical protein
MSTADAKTLIVLRHAQAGWPDAADDHARPLAERGHAQAPAAGDWLAIEWIPQRDLTIDRGRDLRGRMEAVDAGLDSEENFCEEMFGTTAGAVRRLRVNGIAEKMALCEAAGVPYEVAYPPKAGTAAPVAPPPATEKPAEDETDIEESDETP